MPSHKWLRPRNVLRQTRLPRHQLHCIGWDSERRTPSLPPPSACATQHSLICQLCAWDHKQPVLFHIVAIKLNLLDAHTKDKEMEEIKQMPRKKGEKKIACTTLAPNCWRPSEPPTSATRCGGGALETVAPHRYSFFHLLGTGASRELPRRHALPLNSHQQDKMKNIHAWVHGKDKQYETQVLVI